MCAVDGWSLPCRSEVDEVEFRVMQERGLISQVIIRLPACIRMCESCIVCSEARNVEYIVEMIARDHGIASYVHSRTLDYTYERELLLDYLAREVMNTRWPIYGDGIDEGEKFQEKFNKLVEERGWKK